MSFDSAFQWPDDGRGLHCGLKMLNNRPPLLIELRVNGGSNNER